MGAGEGRGGGRYTGKKCRLVSMFSLTVVFFLVEIIVGKLRIMLNPTLGSLMFYELCC